MAEVRRSRDIVLVVDDSPDTLGLLTDALEDNGVTVLVATSGGRALEAVRRVTPDVILMDALMPVVDGFDTCRHLKADPLVAHVPIIFMTGLSETEHILKGLAAGGVDYLTKPINVDELLARIRVHLANSRAAQTARIALDAAGRYLVAADGLGRIVWATPQALRLLEGSASAAAALREAVTARLKQIHSLPPEGVAARIEGGTALFLGFLGQVGDNEFLFRLTASGGDDGTVLRTRYGLTVREAEVLLWIGRGKSNRDIGEILGLSPRTVNKHLEQIYVKLGIENRASAAVLAARALDDR
jgi:DNA-binding response OmpR family regulator/DNA-binding CsgD family transcriptional regulator